MTSSETPTLSSDKDEDALLAMLIPESVHASALTRQECQEYLRRLTSLPMDRLASEPATLEAESAKIKVQMENLAFENYKSFIETADCVRDVTTEIGNINNNVAAVVESLPSLVQVCDEFVRAAADAVAIRKVNKIALQRHDTLVEFLEIPQLLHTMVSNGFYEEALELEAFAQKIVQTHPTVPLLRQLAAEIRASNELLVQQLHEQLKGQIQLPTCLRVVGYLKRLNLYTDEQLRMSFLQSRDAWLTSVLSSIPHDSAYSFLSRLADTARLHIFEIVTQYRAIFASGRADERLKDNDETSNDDGDDSANALLHGWLIQRAAMFINALRYDLPNVNDGASIASLLDQSMYFGLSLGRVGADFRALLTPLFAARITELFQRGVAKAARRCVKRINTMPVPAALDASSLHPSLHTTSSNAAPQPSATISQHVWLALLCNGWLSALNELRQCAAWQIAPQCAEALSMACADVAEAIRAVAKDRHLEETEQTRLSEFARCYGNDVLPFINDCFETVYKGDGARRRRQLLSLVDAKKALAGLYSMHVEETSEKE